jgi:hypothetical protein
MRLSILKQECELNERKKHIIHLVVHVIILKR